MTVYGKITERIFILASTTITKQAANSYFDPGPNSFLGQTRISGLNILYKTKFKFVLESFGPFKKLKQRALSRTFFFHHSVKLFRSCLTNLFSFSSVCDILVLCLGVMQ